MSWLRPTAFLLASLAAGCGDGVIGTMYPDPPLPALQELDVLLVVDERRRADDALELFATQAAELVHVLLGPTCVTPGERLVPAGPGGCGSNERASRALVSLRVGVVAGALADGASRCDGTGRLLRPDGEEAVLLATGGDAAARDAFAERVRARVLSARAERAGREARGTSCERFQPLETARRFLAEPAPLLPEGGTDAGVLSDRASLLRPLSTVLTVVLSPDDDCSLRPGAGALLDHEGPLPRARDVCSQHPDDACCAPCGAAVPERCGADPSCEKEPLHSAASDPPSLRCWEARRRFGVDVLEEPSRYVSAWRDTVLEGGAPNALFRNGRAPSRALLAAFAGVPHQSFGPAGLSINYPGLPPVPWELLSGADGGAPADVHMWESRAPRPGLPEPGAPPTDPKSGAEHAFPDELQFSCIFPLAEARTCGPPPFGETASEPATCACAPGAPLSPLCDRGTPTLQVFAGAAPGRRVTDLVRGLKTDTAVLGSACALGEPWGLGHSTGAWVLGTLAR